MGLDYSFCKGGKMCIKNDTSVLDVGGGPVSMLLKLPKTDKKRTVIDPLAYPSWVMERYKSAGITYIQDKGENILKHATPNSYDEVWMYNCLQHTINPRKIVEALEIVGSTLRIFEWVEKPTDEGHLHTLHKSELDYWLGREGKVLELNQNYCHGQAYINIITP